MDMSWDIIGNMPVGLTGEEKQNPVCQNFRIRKRFSVCRKEDSISQGQ